MSLLPLFGISSAFASGTAASSGTHTGLLGGPLPMFVLIAVVFYFLLIRPQKKRAQAQKKLIADIAVGDEVASIGGIVGTIESLNEQFVVLRTSESATITLKKGAIDSVLPKGTQADLAQADE
jgi:preprotein translocase subunit YajC